MAGECDENVRYLDFKDVRKDAENAADLGIRPDQAKQAAALSLGDGSIIYHLKMIMEAEEVLDVCKKAY